MTNDINTPVPDDDDLFEGATDTFPAKFDLRDRLVVIYPNGKRGQRQGENGKPYDWYETTTVVLDDGPKGWSDTGRDDHGNDREMLVPSVKDEGAQVLENFQWSAGGLTSRLAKKLPDASGKPGSVLGRINSRPGKSGRNPSWSISAPTAEDMELARTFRAECAAARNKIQAEAQKNADEAAF